LSPYAVAEILGLSEAQEQRFMQTYAIAKQVLRDLGILPHRGKAQREPSPPRPLYLLMGKAHLMDADAELVHLFVRDSLLRTMKCPSCSRQSSLKYSCWSRLRSQPEPTPHAVEEAS